MDYKAPPETFKSHLKPNLLCDIESIAILEAWFQVTSENVRT